MDKLETMKQQFAQIPMEEIPNKIRFYQEDGRKGVQKLLQQYEKKWEAYQKEQKRMVQMWMFERQNENEEWICGVDEAGRGPLAGPVVAAAVILPKDCKLLYINDSKQLSAKKREQLYEEIQNAAVSVGVGIVGADRIDAINILQATYEAMRIAVSNLSVKPSLLLNDAVTIPNLEIRQIPIVKGDAKSVSIAAASIIAKVTRDRMMEQYDQLFPDYGFSAHKGYGSSFHIQQLKQLGPCPIHRKTFIKHFCEVG